MTELSGWLKENADHWLPVDDFEMLYLRPVLATSRRTKSAGLVILHEHHGSSGLIYSSRSLVCEKLYLHHLSFC
jgi:hypothetical protein